MRRVRFGVHVWTLVGALGLAMMAAFAAPAGAVSGPSLNQSAAAAQYGGGPPPVAPPGGGGEPGTEPGGSPPGTGGAPGGGGPGGNGPGGNEPGGGETPGETEVLPGSGQGGNERPDDETTGAPTLGGGEELGRTESGATAPVAEGGALPFTGGLVLPVLLTGAAMLALGVLVRRRTGPHAD